VANGNHTAGWFASSCGMVLSIASTLKAWFTPSAAGAALGPRRMPSQISRSTSFGRQNSVLLPDASIVSQAPGSLKPVR
jgi:hypothetical protein